MNEGLLLMLYRYSLKSQNQNQNSLKSQKAVEITKSRLEALNNLKEITSWIFAKAFKFA